MAKKKSKGKKLIIGNHELIPKHFKISDKEKRDIMKNFHIGSAKEFPKIFKNDAGIQSLNVKVGDVVKVIRKEPTGESIYYRVVVSA